MGRVEETGAGSGAAGAASGAHMFRIMYALTTTKETKYTTENTGDVCGWVHSSGRAS